MRADLPGIFLTRRSLIKMSLAIFLSFVAVSVLYQWWGDPSPGTGAAMLYYEKGSREGERILVGYLRRNPDDRAVWVQLAKLRWLTGPRLWNHPSAEVRELLGITPDLIEQLKATDWRDWGKHLDDAEFDAFLNECPVLPMPVLRAWRDSRATLLALAHLDGLADSVEAQRAGGQILLESGRPAEAVEWCARGRALAPGDAELTTLWVKSLDLSGDSAAVGRALNDPQIRAQLPARFVYEYFSERAEWGRSFPYLILAQLEHLTLGLVLTCLAVGACWTILCLHFSRGWFWPRTMQALVPVALLLGTISALLCLIPVVLTDQWLNSHGGSGLMHSMVHSLLIGIREELCKLILFLPLVPFLRRATDAQILTVASLVGLGFAIQENTGYYYSSVGSAILGRYLTANFFHLVLTGFAGFYLVKAIQRGGEAWHQFGSELAKVMVLHAAYDFFLIEPSLSDYAIFSSMLFIVIARQYLRMMFRVRTHGAHRVSLTRVFVACLATVSGLHYFYLSTGLGIRDAMTATLMGGLGILIIGFMYFQEFDETVS